MAFTTNTGDTAPIRQGEQLNWQALENYLREHLPQQLAGEPFAPEAVLSVEQFPGGHSNLTYCVQFGAHEFVMRRPPFGPVAPTAHDMPREFRLLSAIHPVFPLAPRPYLLCEDLNVIGAPFYLMERRRGLIVRHSIPPEIGDNLALRRQVSEGLVDTLAALHTVDIEKHGLDKLGKPVGFVKRQVEGWARRWERSKTTDLPEMTALAEWLRAHLPAEPARHTLVHNDFKLDNVMLDPREPARIIAVLDWEMCTVGDPLVDLGLLLCYWPQPGDPPVLTGSLSPVTMQPGWYLRDEIVARYAEKTGCALAGIDYYYILALFKLAVVLQQIYYRYHVGQTQDERFKDFDQRVAALVMTGYERMRKQA